ncbi:hypothetical protein D9M69_672540 [compost metagenome]
MFAGNALAAPSPMAKLLISESSLYCTDSVPPWLSNAPLIRETRVAWVMVPLMLARFTDHVPLALTSAIREMEVVSVTPLTTLLTSKFSVIFNAVL